MLSSKAIVHRAFTRLANLAHTHYIKRDVSGDCRGWRGTRWTPWRRFRGQ